MILGFTGTQRKPSLEQFDALYELVIRLTAGIKPVEAHHGDCIGADYTFHAICLELDIPVILHPPIVADKRAFCESATSVMDEKDYLVRNKDIVNVSDIVVACPPTFVELKRSGTWSTWRYAKKNGKETYIVFPNGVIEQG